MKLLLKNRREKIFQYKGILSLGITLSELTRLLKRPRKQLFSNFHIIIFLKPQRTPGEEKTTKNMENENGERD